MSTRLRTLDRDCKEEAEMKGQESIREQVEASVPDRLWKFMRKYDPVEFEVSTWRGGEDVQVTFSLDKSERDMLEGAANCPGCPYRSIDDVFRHSVYRHIKYLAEVMHLGLGGFYLTDTFRTTTEARQQLQERDFCIVMDIFSDVFNNFWHRDPRAARVLAESLKCRVRRMRSKQLKELYLREIDEMLGTTRSPYGTRQLPAVSLKPSDFDPGTEHEQE